MTIRTLLGALLLIAMSVGGAHGFGTVNRLGQAAEHGKITRIALAPYGLGARTLAELSGGKGRFGAVGAPDHPKRGLLSVSAAHCSSADHLDRPGYPQSRRAAAALLEACRQWIFTQLRKAVTAAGRTVNAQGRFRSLQLSIRFPCTYAGTRGRAKCDVMGALGVAFHAAQDFYAHTNWVDVARKGRIGPANPPGLGNASRAAWLDPRRQAAFPRGLISGCFKGLPERNYCRGRIRHADLNKDLGPIDATGRTIGPGRTPRGKVNGNFARAVRAAIADTRDKWAYFEARVLIRYGNDRGRRIVCAIRRDDTSGC